MIYKDNQYARAKKKGCDCCSGCYFYENLSTLDCLLASRCYDPDTDEKFIWVKINEISQTPEDRSYSI